MTQVEALYRYATHPTEATLVAIGNLREVYGIRNVRFDQAASTIRIEYDATRLSEPNVHQLLRRTGLDIGSHETLAFPPPPPPPQPAAS